MKHQDMQCRHFDVLLQAIITLAREKMRAGFPVAFRHVQFGEGEFLVWGIALKISPTSSKDSYFTNRCNRDTSRRAASASHLSFIR